MSMPKTVIIMMFILVCTAGRANADLLFTLTPSTQSVQPGGTVTFSGILQNTGSTDVYINGDINPGITPLFSVDDTKFIFNAPASLAPGDFWSGDLFDVRVAVNASPGNLIGEFTVLGGNDGGALDSIGTQSFTVSLPFASVPEPRGTALLGSTVLCAAFLLNRRRRQLSQSRLTVAYLCSATFSLTVEEEADEKLGRFPGKGAADYEESG